MNDATQALDLSTATMDDLEALSIDQLLGNDISDYSLSSNLPDGTYILLIDDYELTRRAADMENEKKASVSLNVKFKVVSCIQCGDPDVDTATLPNRVHFERFNLLTEMGQGFLVKTLLGAAGVSWKDKKAIAEVAKSPAVLLEEFKASKVAFGAQIKTVERNGYENCNIVQKEPSYIGFEDAMQYL